MSFHVPERYRLVDGPMPSDESDGNNGCFFMPSPIGERALFMIASDGLRGHPRHAGTSARILGVYVREAWSQRRSRI